MEKNEQELREILARDHDEHREQMARMMQVIMRMACEKDVDDTGTVNIVAQTQGVIEGFVNLPVNSVIPDEGTYHYPTHH